MCQISFDITAKRLVAYIKLYFPLLVAEIVFAVLTNPPCYNTHHTNFIKYNYIFYVAL